MKKLFAWLLALCFAASLLCACSDKDGETSDAPETTDTQATETTVVGEFANDNEAYYHSSW